jgi:hypothetical protein
MTVVSEVLIFQFLGIMSGRTVAANSRGRVTQRNYVAPLLTGGNGRNPWAGLESNAFGSCGKVAAYALHARRAQTGAATSRVRWAASTGRRTHVQLWQKQDCHLQCSDCTLVGRHLMCDAGATFNNGQPRDIETHSRHQWTGRDALSLLQLVRPALPLSKVLPGWQTRGGHIRLKRRTKT